MNTLYYLVYHSPFGVVKVTKEYDSIELLKVVMEVVCLNMSFEIRMTNIDYED